MPGGRPRKPSGLRSLEGNRSRTDIPPEVQLSGVPECPEYLDSAAAAHFNKLAEEFGGAGVLKRVDGEALAMLADLWSKYWEASESKDLDAMCKLKQRWDSAASKLGIQVIDRSKLMSGQKQSVDPLESKYGVVG